MDELIQYLKNIKLGEQAVPFAIDVLFLVGLLITAYLLNFIVKRIALAVVGRVVSKTANRWDDIILNRKVFDRLSHLVPALIIYIMAPFVFEDNATASNFVQKTTLIAMLFLSVFALDAFLSAVADIYATYDISRKVPIRGVVQIIKLALYVLIIIVSISVVIGKSPQFLIGGLGAMTAVIMLIFKDPILGFAAGIQISANKMVQIGDWIEMPNHGADGEVAEINLTTVKVQNWDKTITTVPTFALVNESVKNWRGMSESGGRRIKRSIYIDISSIKFCTREMLDKFKQIQFISEYIQDKKHELAKYNEDMMVDDTVLVNGRRLTNIGTLRAYIVAYLRNHPNINQEMTFLVRQLEPGPNGIPIEIYVFSSDKVWANYEAIQADIFDHILAVVPEFDLRIFQHPTGKDFRNFRQVNGATQ